MSVVNKIQVTEAALETLSEPFAPEAISWRVQRSGVKNGRPWLIVVPYITSRAIQDRLDEVVGAANWQNDSISTPGGMLCALKIRINGEWVTKTDGAEGENSVEGMDKIKAACSRAMVRAAVLWGMGRYLYEMPTCFGEIVEAGTPNAYWAKIDGKEYSWLPPGQMIPTATSNVSIPEVRTRAHEVPNVIAPSYAQGPKPAPVQAIRPPVGAHFRDAAVPFGVTMGQQLKDLPKEDVQGLVDFYSKVTGPKGKAKTFKPIFFAYLDSINWKQ